MAIEHEFVKAGGPRSQGTHHHTLKLSLKLFLGQAASYIASIRWGRRIRGGTARNRSRTRSCHQLLR